MRMAIGVSAAMALGLALVAWLNGESTMAGVAARMGIILAALWIAFPQFSENRPRNYLGALVAVAVLVWRPRSAVILLPVLAFVFSRRQTGKSP